SGLCCLVPQTRPRRLDGPTSYPRCLGRLPFETGIAPTSRKLAERRKRIGLEPAVSVLATIARIKGQSTCAVYVGKLISGCAVQIQRLFLTASRFRKAASFSFPIR